jgi:hypothetical protein
MFCAGCCYVFAAPALAFLQDQIKLTAQLAGPLAQLQAAAKRVAEVSQECMLEINEGVCLILFYVFLEIHATVSF